MTMTRHSIKGERMNKTYKERVQEPYNEAWSILKTIRDDNSDEAWKKFREQLDTFYERVASVPKRGNENYIKGEKQYLESLYMVLLNSSEMAAWILEHEEKDS